MTCLPETIGPIKPSGDQLKGIFYELKKIVVNPILMFNHQEKCILLQQELIFTDIYQ